MKPSQPETQSQPEAPDPVRKPYAKPELREFGRVSDLTKAVDLVGTMDNALNVTKT